MTNKFSLQDTDQHSTVPIASTMVSLSSSSADCFFNTHSYMLDSNISILEFSYRIFVIVYALTSHSSLLASFPHFFLFRFLLLLLHYYYSHFFFFSFHYHPHLLHINLCYILLLHYFHTSWLFSECIILNLDEGVC